MSGCPVYSLCVALFMRVFMRLDSRRFVENVAAAQDRGLLFFFVRTSPERSHCVNST